MHNFSTTVPRCCKDFYASSFFPRTAIFWSSFLGKFSPLTSNVNAFKSRVHWYLSLDFFKTDFPYAFHINMAVEWQVTCTWICKLFIVTVSSTTQLYWLKNYSVMSLKLGKPLTKNLIVLMFDIFLVFLFSGSVHPFQMQFVQLLEFTRQDNMHHARPTD